MDPRSVISSNTLPGQTHSPVLLIGLVFGLCANYLIWPGGLQGPGFAAWLTLLAIAALVLVRNTGSERFRVVALWGAVAILAAVILIFRNLEVLLPAMWLVIFSAAAMIFLHVTAVSLANARVPDLLVALLQVPLHAGAGAVVLLRRIDLPSLSSNPKLAGLLRGLLMALPLLVVFSLLFSSADVAFSRLLPDVAEIFSVTTTWRVVLILFFTWVSAGLLQGVSQAQTPSVIRPAWSFRLGAEETAVIMSLLAALFVVFVVLQIRYLFGGREIIEATTGLTLADYARRGFFELIIVAGLTLMLLLFLGATSGSQRLFRLLAAVLTGCVLIILASAVQRFDLYIDAYGLTVDRLVALTVLVWFAVSLALFAGTVLRERVAWFASGTAICGVVVTLLFGLLNPAYQVARVNIERTIESRQENAIVFQSPIDLLGFSTAINRLMSNGQLDIDYLLSLGADVVPLLLEHLDQLAPHEQCIVATYLLEKWNNEDATQNADSDWRTWNASKAAAKRAVNAQERKLQEIIRAFKEDFGFLLTTPLPGLRIC